MDEGRWKRYSRDWVHAEGRLVLWEVLALLGNTGVWRLLLCGFSADTEVQRESHAALEAL